MHYAWPHPRHRLLYVASSWRMLSPRDDGHMLSVVEVPAHGTPLRQVSASVPLPARPIHMTVDRTGSFVAVLFNDPPGLQVHALAADGSLAGLVRQRVEPDVGIYPHQVRVTPCNRWLLVAARGNNPGPGRSEDPGSLRRFAFEAGRLQLAQVVAPDGGFGFGPRHLDFHPHLPCIYISVERQNQLHVYHHADWVIDDRPRQVLSTIVPDKKPSFEQFAGAVHVHPAGSFVYVANRDDPHPGMEGSHITGDNSMAIFRVDPATGSVSPPKHSELDAFHVRTFSLRPPFLVAASIADVTLPGRQGPRRVPASLGVFRMADNGALAPVHRTLVDTQGSLLWWSGFLEAYGAQWA